MALPPLLGEVGIALGVYDGMTLDIVLGKSDPMFDSWYDGVSDGTELNDGDTLTSASSSLLLHENSQTYDPLTASGIEN